MQRPSKNLYVWLFAIILFGAFAFRLSGLGSQSLWHDEAWSIMSAYHPLAWGMQGTDPNAPPVFYMSLGGWMQFVGDSVWALRSWSLLLGVLLVAIVGWLARRWYGNRAGLLAALFVAFNPMLWTFSQEIRAYVVMPLGAILLLFLMERILQTRSRRAWIYLAAVEWLTLYSQNLAVPIVAWLNVTMIAALLLRREWRKLFRWMIVQGVLGLLYLPWLITQKPTGTPFNTTPPINFSLLWNIWQSYFSGIRTMINVDPDLMILCLLLGVCTVALMLVDYRKLRTALLLSQAVLIPIFETAIIYAAHIDFHPRYYIVGVPAFLMLLAAGSTVRLPPTKNNKSGPSLWWLQSACAVLTVVIGVHVLQLVATTPIYRHDDFRAIAERYKRDLTADDAIIIPYGYEPTLNYYIEKMKIPAQVITLPLYSSSQTIINTLSHELPKVRRAEFLTWYQVPADVRGAYPCLLNGNGIKAESLTVQGIRTDAYTIFRFGEHNAWSLPNGLDFGVINLESVFDLISPDGVCVVQEWMLRKQTDHPLRLSTKVMLSPLTEMANTDSDLLDDHQQTTSRWETGQPIQTFTWLPLPSARASGTMSIKVYSVDAPNGLDAIGCVLPNGGEACTPKNMGKRPQFGAVDTKVSDTLLIRRHDTDLELGHNLVVQDKYPLRTPLAQGECEDLHTGLYTHDDIMIDISIGYLKTFTNGKTVINPTPLGPISQLYFVERFCVPTDAKGSVKVALVVLDEAGKPTTSSISLGEIQITELARTYTAPELPNLSALNASFPTLATLKGLQLPAKIQAGQPFDATLLWQTEYQKDANLRVFVQVLDNQGRLIAQHDGVPVNGTRPANNWEKDEYLTDTHKVEWARSDYKGTGTLIIGFYDPDTSLRALTTDGKDHIEIPITIE